MAKGRFEGVNLSDFIIKELDPDLENLGQGFKCKRNDFATYIKGEKIKNECKALTSRGWVLEYENHVGAYITLLADKLTLEKPLLKNEGLGYVTFPAIKIGWLAGDRRVKGGGTRLLDWAIEYISKDLIYRVGIRFITVDALYDPDTNYDVSGYYEGFGFKYANPNEALPPQGNYRTMYYDIKAVLDELELIRAENQNRAE